MSRCPCRACSFPSLPWVALCVICYGGIFGEIAGDPPADDEVFDSPSDAALAYPEGRP